MIAIWIALGVVSYVAGGAVTAYLLGIVSARDGTAFSDTEMCGWSVTWPIALPLALGYLAYDWARKGGA